MCALVSSLDPGSSLLLPLVSSDLLCQVHCQGLHLQPPASLPSPDTTSTSPLFSPPATRTPWAVWPASSPPPSIWPARPPSRPPPHLLSPFPECWDPLCLALAPPAECTGAVTAPSVALSLPSLDSSLHTLLRLLSGLTWLHQSPPATRWSRSGPVICPECSLR